MNPNEITGNIPDFLLSHKLTDLALQMFSSTWIQPTQLDENVHELIQQMHSVGLIDMALALDGGVQIVCYRLAQGDEE